MKRALQLAVALGLILSGGCASTLLEGDRYFLAGDFVRAERAYVAFLTSGRPAGNDASRARYHLGLIYALPGTDLSDRQEARTALESVIELDPESAWAQPAALVLENWRDTDRLRRELEDQRSQVAFLYGEVDKLQDEAERAEGEVEDREARMEQLNGEIGRLKTSIGRLEASLAKREDELDRIKKIDLETPP